MSEVLELKDTNAFELKLKRVVVAVDLSSHSPKTIAYAAAFAKSFGASLTLVHVFAQERITEFSNQVVHEGYEGAKRAAERELNKLADNISKDYPDCSTEFRVGDPAEEVILFASDVEADLIVTASHHSGFLSRMFGVEQAPRILHRALCPVLVYHERKE